MKRAPPERCWEAASGAAPGPPRVIPGGGPPPRPSWLAIGRGRVLPRALEHVRLGQLREAQLVDLHVRAEGHEADARVVGERVQGGPQGPPRRRELVSRARGVEHEDVRRRGDRRGGRRLVLDRRRRREELRGEVLVRDARVVRRERVAGVAQGTGPQPGLEVDRGVGVEHAAAALAAHRVVGTTGAFGPRGFTGE